MKKLMFFVMIALVGIGGSGVVLDQILAKQGGIGHLSSAIEAIRLRSEKPGMPPDVIQREAAKANQGVVGLIKTLADGATHGLGRRATDENTPVDNAPTGKADPAKDVYIRVSENHDAILNAQVGTSSDVKDIKGASHEIATGQKVNVQSTSDGREVLAVIQDSSIEDLNAVDRINAMNIPQNLRDQILKNYYATGAMPEIVVKESRRPTNKSSGSNDPDDPYNPKNF